MNLELISQNEETTITIGRIIGQSLNSGTIITLTGDLGAGKTTLSKGIAFGLDVKEHITSPTYTIVHEYTGRLPLYHFDTYRIADCDEMYDIGFEEYIYGEGVCLIEWPQRIEDLLPDTCINVIIQRINNADARKIIVQFTTINHEKLIKQMAETLKEEGFDVIEKKE